MSSDQKLDVYTYADMKGAHLRVAIRGKEWYARCINPQCSSKNDAFSVQPDGRTWGRWAGYGAWKCRKCWDSEEIIIRRDGTRGKRGWGSIADLVMRCEGMTYKEAEQFILEYEGQTISATPRSAPVATLKTDEAWCAESLEYLAASQQVTQAERDLIQGYFASRGLTIETAHRLGLGYSLDKVKLEDGTYREIPFLVIPWYKDKAENTLYRKVNRRNLHSPMPDDEPKYKTRWQSTNDALYLGEILLSSKRPTFLIESELDAATVLQEAGDLVNVVATGTCKGGRNAVNEGRLRRQPFVFFAFDADEAGEEAATYWKSKLDSERCVRYRPLMHDPNEMHTTEGYSVRQWVEEGLARFVFVPEQPQESPSITAYKFYEAFCSTPGQTLRLREDGLVGIGVPESMSDAEYEQIVDYVCACGQALLQVLKEKALTTASYPALSVVSPEQPFQVQNDVSYEQRLTSEIEQVRRLCTQAHKHLIYWSVPDSSFPSQEVSPDEYCRRIHACTISKNAYTYLKNAYTYLSALEDLAWQIAYLHQRAANPGARLPVGGYKRELIAMKARLGLNGSDQGVA